MAPTDTGLGWLRPIVARLIGEAMQLVASPRGVLLLSDSQGQLRPEVALGMRRQGQQELARAFAELSLAPRRTLRGGDPFLNLSCPLGKGFCPGAGAERLCSRCVLGMIQQTVAPHMGGQSVLYPLPPAPDGTVEGLLAVRRPASGLVAEEPTLHAKLETIESLVLSARSAQSGHALRSLAKSELPPPSVESPLEAACRLALEITGWERAAAFMVDSDSRYHVAAAVGFLPQEITRRLAHVFLREEKMPALAQVVREGTTLQVPIIPGSHLFAPQYIKAFRMQSAVSTPISAFGETLGVLYVDLVSRTGVLTPEQMYAIEVLGRQTATVLTATKALEDLRAREQEIRDLATAAILNTEDVSKKVAHELHDSLLQCLYGLRCQLEGALATEDPGDMRETVVSTEAILDQCIDESRALIRGLRPHVLEDLGLEEALRALLREQKTIETDLSVRGSADVRGSQLEACLFRVAQEALGNALHHGQPTSVRMELTLGPKEAQLAVQDDGAGFDTERQQAPGHYGLRFMRERVAMLGGSLEVRSQLGHGTLVRARAPIQQGKRR